MVFVSVVYTLGATRVSAATEPDEWAKIEWVRTDWQTCGRTHESMKWVVLIRIGALTLPNSDHLATSPRFSSLARTPLFRFLCPALFSIVSLPTLLLFSVLFFLILLLLPLIFSSSSSSLSFSSFSSIVVSSATRVSYSSPPSLSSPFLALHSIYR